MAHYLRRIRLTCSVPALHALADEIERQFPDDEKTSQLFGVIAAKFERLAKALHQRAHLLIQAAETGKE